MIKRGIIQLGGASPKFRISKPGVDVDSADETDFLLHEEHLYTQPYHFEFVACPFAGNTSLSSLTEDVLVTIPGVTDDPIVLVWPVASDGRIAYPKVHSQGPGHSTTGFIVDRWSVRTIVNSATSLTVRFSKPSTSLRSPNGAYIILMRRPT